MARFDAEGVNSGQLDCFVRIGTLDFDLSDAVGLEDEARGRKVEEGFRSLFKPEMQKITAV